MSPMFCNVRGETISVFEFEQLFCNPDCIPTKRIVSPDRVWRISRRLCTFSRPAERIHRSFLPTCEGLAGFISVVFLMIAAGVEG